ncbi:CoA ester lyase [Vibrio sp. S4M6]|uniref:HpcH/HpaI aldolase/citrate lyase family protein n=1 Tax=Vibrio sinus TaxID=2946865 RepID=UPI00202A3F1C|nr:CoA ester lyase [Vibrio sinus]MCL9780286.1 CoA ester lyase [Vibrio sinus]
MKKVRPELCNSLLFTPANRPERFEKSGSNKSAQMVVLDLEDAVSLRYKDQAREILIDYLQHNPSIPSDHPMITAVRINAISTHAGLKDIVCLVRDKVVPDVVFLPKVQNVQEIELYAQLLNQGKKQNVQFIAAIETAVGLENAHQIAAHPDVVAIGFGGADLAADLGVDLTFDNTQVYRARIVQAAKYAGIVAWDVPYLDFRDEPGLIKETQQIKAMGFNAKIAIHPAQLAPINKTFLPSEEEVNEAKEILITFKQANGSACQYKGKMLDIPVVKRSQDILERVGCEY